MSVDLRGRVSGVRSVLIFFLGLNVAWMETCYNALVMGGNGEMLGWIPFGWYMTAGEWFWTHLVLTMLTAAILIYSYETQIQRGETSQC